MENFSPKKSLGQHFLANKDICARIVSILAPENEDKILEIGPGPGALTNILQNAPHKELLLLEKDLRFAKLRAREADRHTTIVNMDALNFSWKRLSALGKWKIIGNLPYNVASPLIWEIISHTGCWKHAVFMTQKEVGERICAKPGNKKYGALSIWVQAHAIPGMEFTLKPGAFMPPPKVDSSVISFMPAVSIPVFPEKLKQLLNICFQNRRKQLGTIFRRSGLEKILPALEEMGIRETARPETISVQEFTRLSEYL